MLFDFEIGQIQIYDKIGMQFQRINDVINLSNIIVLISWRIQLLMFLRNLQGGQKFFRSNLKSLFA